MTSLETPEARGTRAARLIASAGPVFLHEAGDREFWYQSDVRRRQRRDTNYQDPRVAVAEKASKLATQAGRQSAVAAAMAQLPDSAFDFITESDTIGDDYEEQPGDRLRWGSQRKASVRRAVALRRAAQDLVLAASVHDLLTEAEFRLMWRPFESAFALEALHLGSLGRYGPNTDQVEAFIEMIASLGRQDLRELFRGLRSGRDSAAHAMYLLSKTAVFTGLKDEVAEAERAVRKMVDESNLYQGDWNQSNWLARAFNQELDRLHHYGHSWARDRTQRAAAALVVRQGLTDKDFNWLFWPYQRRFDRLRS